MILAALTLFHVVISLAGILYGLIAAFGMAGGSVAKRPNEWFLITTIATSVTGFFFPVDRFLPSHAVGIVSLIVLAFAGIAFWRHNLRGAWLTTYAIGAVIALYLNVFVLVVQLFRRVPALNVLAPTQTEPAFQIAQLAVLLASVLLGILAVKGVKKGSGTSMRAPGIA